MNAPTSKPKVNNSKKRRTCGNCLFYSEHRRNPFSPPMQCNLHMSIKDPQQAACANYRPKQTD